MLLASLWRDLFDPGYLVSNPLLLIAAGFQIWMFVDALRRQEWIWAVCIFVFSVLSAVLYFFMVYRRQGAASGGGSIAFELPGARTRARMKEIQDRIYHLDHARDHLDLADLHFSAGRYAKAEVSYRESLKRDATDPDAIAHLGQCLLRLKRPTEAKPLLEQALAMDPRHDYGHTLMALAETQTALGETDASLKSWQQVLANNSYARAKVQYAELLAARGDTQTAKTLAREVIDDDRFAPKFQRGRDKHWVRRAGKLTG
jgi:hypothetical protein